jgi:hypothetical protein
VNTYKRYSPSTHSIFARLDGKGCWLERKPSSHVTESASFRATPRNGPSDRLTRRYELGRVDQYYSAIHRGIGDGDLINLYSSEQEAQQDYKQAVNRCDEDVRWQRIGIQKKKPA